MRLSYETCLIGDKCVLVPYRPEHVETYHDWMKDPTLLEATGSEPLSLEEEIQMQHSWRDDPEKCTFIVLAKCECSDGDAQHDESLSPSSIATTVDADFIQRNLKAMVGDVNLFLSEEEEEAVSDDEQEAEVGGGERGPKFMQAELDIMIAEHAHRGQGLGREASCLMMMYAAMNLGIRRFFCKINEDNHASRGLFEKMGFRQCNYAECFRQVELELKRNGSEQMTEDVGMLLGRSDLQVVECPLRNKETDC